MVSSKRTRISREVVDEDVVVLFVDDLLTSMTEPKYLIREEDEKVEDLMGRGVQTS